jgi:Mn-containing catalase
MFEAALATIQPNFPPGVFQSDPRFSNVYFNMSTGNDFTGPWNEGTTTQLGEELQYIDDPIKYVLETNGLLSHEPKGTDRTAEGVAKADRQTSKLKSAEVKGAVPEGVMQWNAPLAVSEEAQGSSEEGDQQKQNRNGNGRKANGRSGKR